MTLIEEQTEVKATAPAARMYRYTMNAFTRFRESALAESGKNSRCSDRRFQYELGIAFAMFIWKANAREQWFLLKTLLNCAEQWGSPSEQRLSECPAMLMAAEQAYWAWRSLSTAQQRAIQFDNSKGEREVVAELESKREDFDKFCWFMVRATALPEGHVDRR